MIRLRLCLRTMALVVSAGFVGGASWAASGAARQPATERSEAVTMFAVPPPYRYMPDRQVQGQVAVGEAESWKPSVAATMIRRGGFRIDVGALRGLAPEASSRVLEYVCAVVDRVNEAGKPPEMEQWVLLEGQWGPRRCGGGGQIRHWFPSDFEVSESEGAPVPLKVFPSPSLVRASAAERIEHAETESIQDLVRAGAPIGRTLVYEHGALKPDFVEGMRNGERLFRVLPLATPAVASTITEVAPLLYAPQYGRLVVPNTDEAWQTVRGALRATSDVGARFFGEIQTVGILPEVSVRRVVTSDGRFADRPALVYEVWDGLEGVRCDAPNGVDPLAVRVRIVGPGAGARLGSYELFRSPYPVRREPGASGRNRPVGAHPQERIVLGDQWADAEPPVVIVRKGEGWEPYCESLIITNEPGEVKPGDGSLLMLGVFSAIAPEDLVATLAAFAGVDAGPILADEGFMRTLRELHARAQAGR